MRGLFHRASPSALPLRADFDMEMEVIIDEGFAEEGRARVK